MDSAVLTKQTKEQEMNTEKMIALLSEVKEKADEVAASVKCISVMQKISAMMPSYGHSWVFYATPVVCGGTTNYTANKEQLVKFVTAKLIALGVTAEDPASAPTIAAKIVALSSAHNDADFVPAAAAVAAGLEFSEDIIQFDQVAPFTIAMHSLENSNLGRVPNLVDFRGSHYRLLDGSWILFRADWGRYPIVSNGKLEEDPIGGHD